MKQVFEDGFFHADPHPGNLFLHVFTDQANRPQPFQVKQRVGVLGGVDYSLKWQEEAVMPPYQVIFLDFGMMGHLDQSLRSRLADALIALIPKTPKKSVKPSCGCATAAAVPLTKSPSTKTCKNLLKTTIICR